MYLYYDLVLQTYVLEIWGASTKHPDCVMTMKDAVDSGHFSPSILGDDVSLYQWLLYCASTMMWPHSSVKIVELATQALNT